MKFKMEKDRILIIPENQIDEEYLENLNLRCYKDKMQAMRINIGYADFALEIKKIERKIEIPTLKRE